MSYLVLARKYRPQRFSELIGQEHVARTLSNAIAQNRVHHAFLFTGARGVGKTSAARILAKALSCEKGPTAEPCGVCDICQEIAGGRSVDVIEIDAASNTKVEETKSVLEGVRYLPARARRKVYIIDEVHMLSAHSWNALLKTLEEPPPHVVFVFATTEVHKIPATILSRCQRFDFKLISTARLTTHLTEILRSEKIDAAPEAVRLVARQAAGSVRDGLSLLDQTIAYVGTERLTAEVTADVLGIADRQLLVALTVAVLDRDPGAALRLIARAADRGVDLGQLGRSFLGFLRDLEVVASVKPVAGRRARRPARRDAGGDRRGAGAGRARRAGPGHRSLRLLGARRRRGVAPSDAAPLVRDGGHRSMRGGADGAARRSAATPRRAGGAPAGRRRRAAAVSAPAPSAPPTAKSAAAKPPAPGPRAWGAPVSPAAPSPPVAVVDIARGVGRRRSAVAGRSRPSLRLRRRPPRRSPSASPAEVWRSILTTFEAKRPRLAGLLAHAEVASMTSGAVTLVFPDKFTSDQTEKSRGEVEASISEALGQATRVTFSVGGPANGTTVRSNGATVRSEVGQQSDAAAADRKARENEARQHPRIRNAQDVFGAALKEIKT